MWDLSGPGLEPVSPALAGRFLTTAPPGKYRELILNSCYYHTFCTGSVVVVHRLSCSSACGIFPDQSSSQCPLHWQVDS
ncbi:hypothetical protein J1605_017398 [Eschrichtius robustus]|uniref:Uncharacterized protein n=1 Tax=Eschrichtius robustus TaxID=9764 RepID=A0AB34I157_ESCRO|nr:hypothetical protein J1605_017398 [Eschrichtius robustus]